MLRVRRLTELKYRSTSGSSSRSGISISLSLSALYVMGNIEGTHQDAPVHTMLELVLSTTVDIPHLSLMRGQGNSTLDSGSDRSTGSME
jgi:hypothetical protein